MPDLLILFSIWMKLLSFDIVNFGFPQSLENMVYDFMSFKLFSSGYKHVSSTYWAISPPTREWGGGGRLLNWSDCFTKFFLFGNFGQYFYLLEKLIGMPDRLTWIWLAKITQSKSIA